MAQSRLSVAAATDLFLFLPKTVHEDLANGKIVTFGTYLGRILLWKAFWMHKMVLMIARASGQTGKSTPGHCQKNNGCQQFICTLDCTSAFLGHEWFVRSGVGEKKATRILKQDQGKTQSWSQDYSERNTLQKDHRQKCAFGALALQDRNLSPKR